MIARLDITPAEMGIDGCKAWVFDTHMQAKSTRVTIGSRYVTIGSCQDGRAHIDGPVHAVMPFQAKAGIGRPIDAEDLRDTGIDIGKWEQTVIHSFTSGSGRQ